MKRSVVVLMGGWSAEREVSLVSGEAVVRSLKHAGYEVTPVDLNRDLRDLLEHLSPAPQAVFNALHGRFGEDGRVQGMLDILGIPYTHSGALASALAMDKPVAKTLFEAAGIPVAEHVIVDRATMADGPIMDPPFVVKPLDEGSSVGVHIVREGDNRNLASDELWQWGESVMVERFIRGRELTVAVMGDRPLAVTEITTERGFYDYDAKYAPGGSRHVIPADLEPDLYERVLSVSLLAHQTLGCRGVSRADLRFDGETPIMLEVNTQPGLTPTSLVPEQAAYLGISFHDLVVWMVEHASCDA